MEWTAFTLLGAATIIASAAIGASLLKALSRMFRGRN
jgi:hypothetical protein